MSYREMTPEQLKVVTNAQQVFEAYRHALAEDRRFEGTMHWKRIRGREYLYRGFSGGRTRSLGPRSRETEDLKDRYAAARAEHRERKRSLRESLEVQAGYVRVNRLNRFPLVAARVVRRFAERGVPFRVVGTNALFAYEVSAGVLFLPEQLATDDLDFMVDSRQRARIVTALGEESLLSVLREADTSFARLSDGPFEFSAANRTGFRVDFVTQEGSDPAYPNEFFAHLAAVDLRPQGIGSLKWLVNSPVYRETVFDQRGAPLELPTIDPRVFVVHKLYIAAHERGNALKKKRDRAQAALIAGLLDGPLSHLAPRPELERIFPRGRGKERRPEDS